MRLSGTEIKKRVEEDMKRKRLNKKNKDKNKKGKGEDEEKPKRRGIFFRRKDKKDK